MAIPPHPQKGPVMANIPDTVQTAFEKAAAQRALALPAIPEELRALEADELLDGPAGPLEAIDARDLIIADGNFSELEAAGARFTNCFLSCCDFSGALFTDTVFEVRLREHLFRQRRLHPLHLQELQANRRVVFGGEPGIGGPGRLHPGLRGFQPVPLVGRGSGAVRFFRGRHGRNGAALHHPG